MVTRRATLALLAAAALPRTAAAAPEGAPPADPRVIDLPAMGRETGRPGGALRMLVGGQRDVRLIPINSYARLVGYDDQLRLRPDILSACQVEDDRVYTFRLRRGHRWSDGSPFTAADFRYAWDDVINNTDLYRGGPPVDLRSDGEVCAFDVIDELTVRYSFAGPMPDFLPKLAAPLPLTLFMPQAYMRGFHARHQTPEALATLIAANRVDAWTDLHQKMSRANRPENPDLPTLEAWRPRTAPPAERFVFDRNPHFHRVDQTGQQLPYLDRIILDVAAPDIISAKTATGESDLQAFGLDFPDYTLLKAAETRHALRVSLWRRTQGSSVALLPNLNCADEAWRGLFRDVRMRRALSLAIDREELNKVIYFGLARESADTILPESPLFRPEYATAWAAHDPGRANALLDELGLHARSGGGIRLLPDGRKAGIIVESAGESTLETDVLELITDHMRAVGIALYIRTSQRDVLRSRAMGGDLMMSVWAGLDNGVPTADMAPDDLAPTSADQLQWPVWGSWHMSAETAGAPPDLAPVLELAELLRQWRQSTSTQVRAAIWHRMLALRADQVFSIGTVNAALQPVARSARLRNVPEEGLYGFVPTSFFGAYLPDTFFYDEGQG